MRNLKFYRLRLEGDFEKLNRIKEESLMNRGFVQAYEIIRPSENGAKFDAVIGTDQQVPKVTLDNLIGKDHGLVSADLKKVDSITLDFESRPYKEAEADSKQKYIQGIFRHFGFESSTKLVKEKECYRLVGSLTGTPRSLDKVQERLHSDIVEYKPRD